MSRKSRETIGPNVDIPATTESNAFQDWYIRVDFKKLSDVRVKRSIMAIRILLLNGCCFFTSSQNRWRR